MRTFVYFGERFLQIEEQRSVTSYIRDKAKTWNVIDSTVYGHTSREGIARFQTDVFTYQPDFVAITFGISDAVKLNPVSIYEYRTNLKYMINKLSSNKVILIPPFLFNHENEKEIKKYVEAMKKIATETGSDFLELSHIQSVLQYKEKLGFSIIKRLNQIEKSKVNPKRLFKFTFGK